MSSPEYVPYMSNFDGFEFGDQVYVQVDSANANTTYGAVNEIHELRGEAYNNIFGPSNRLFGVDPTLQPGNSPPGNVVLVLPERPK